MYFKKYCLFKGTHSELLSKNGVYRKLVRKQIKKTKPTRIQELMEDDTDTDKETSSQASSEINFNHRDNKNDDDDDDDDDDEADDDDE